MSILGEPFGVGFGPILLTTDSILNVYAIFLLWKTDFQSLPQKTQNIFNTLKWIVLLSMPGILYDIFSPFLFEAPLYLHGFQFSYLLHFSLSILIIKNVFQEVFSRNTYSISESLQEIAKAHSFTDRETEILHLLRQGLSNKMMAQKLFVSDLTIKKHLQNMYAKAQVTSRFELMGLSK